VANLFFNLPIPAGDGTGAAVDVSTLGALKTFVVGETLGPNGEGFRCSLNIEMSNAAVAPVADNEWAPVDTFNNPGDITIPISAKWLRVRRSDSKTPAGTATCDVGSDDSPATLAAFTVTAGDGSGPSVNTSTLPVYKTVTVGGAFRGNVVVEVSNDGVHFAPQFSMPNGGQQSAAFTAEFMRVSRDGVPVISPGTPIVNIAASNLPGTGSGGGGGPAGFQFFQVAGVAGQSSYAVVLPVARANANYEAIAILNAPGTNFLKGITIDPTTLTNVGFTAVLSTGAEAGDILVFLVNDL
jgi:hypothetical protein